MTARVALIGAGLMGAGLARLFAAQGWPVTIWDRDADAAARLASGSVRVARDLADAVQDADLVIEAIAEIAEAKQALFAELAGLTGEGTILATNSSVIPVGTVAARIDDAQAGRVVGTHFWNPPDLIPLVEVIRGPRTVPATVERTMSLLIQAGREPVRVDGDVVPGNRLQHALWREAMALVDEGLCTPEDVDRIVKRSFGARLAVLGPLENADLVGLELTEQIHRVVLPMLSRATEPSPGLRDRIGAGAAGIAAGKGFHTGWNAQNVAILRDRLSTHLRASFAPGTAT
ncbi:3-hydroxyacyl-CoA dehydrogenase family protein [Sphingomonas sp.]|jgi:3-hydroxybutyryl-CoA dehydrogenase|uniref:3-hydroxyacyl-CoA dehydrogenase family protein n=1 Tax=Sphingomonas sp. TaxID=28214 RepID=UPI002ED85529